MEDDAKDSYERCPACPETVKDIKRKKKEVWVSCENCSTWYHWDCVSKGEDLSPIDKWYCEKCLATNGRLQITYKPSATRKSSRVKPKQDYASMNEGLPSDPNRWTKVLKVKKFAKDRFRRMKGKDVTLEWVESNDDALTEPIVILEPAGLGMKMPGEDFTVDDVAELVGPDAPVEVIDVAQQSSSAGWTLGTWAEYYDKPASQRDRIRNVISLEVTGTKLAEKVCPPRIVSEVDWVQEFWPANKRGGKHQWPKVGLYCLMSVAQAWTDWHVDFAATSVYYHVLKGAKEFYFIKPTESNLAVYEKWSGSAELQAGTWLGDMVEEVIKVSLVEGNTMIIPTGWIHAVYTPVDSLVFGGNFLHSFNIATQLRLRQIEINTKVPKKFRYPYFEKLCWYVAESFCDQLKKHVDLSPRVLRGLVSLADFLVSEARLIESGVDTPQRREAKDAIPGDKVKDASALARELQWRAKEVLGKEDEDEEDERPAKKQKVSNGKGKHRAVTEMDEAVEPGSHRRPKFKNWSPMKWDIRTERDLDERHDVVTAEPPGDWVLREGALDNLGSEGNQGVEHVTTGTEWVRIRRYKGEDGKERVERVRITRVIEDWTWGIGMPEKKPVVDGADRNPGDAQDEKTEVGDAWLVAPSVADGDVDMKDAETGDTAHVAPLGGTELKREDVVMQS
ncbi:Clavaminate synthase-like protein [Dacryopinax primogenitus]|uniref:JmjC domain-containing histone demethylation protein 1 n=1 Tax=Dacryopinax primogenitus (strain DJM 731) TaxID=1858805 RepID=M5GA69_DACPD|nr:Clavaminate synthase-like protein [Dacryopinax primogenitus]EJU05699.1 Clavaminate synthase-like protein [Dacryopinax primogenitus]